jgi:hypothetical protein
MTPPAAFTKLMWLLGTEGVQIAEQLQISQRGEQSENLFDLRYGACAQPQAAYRASRTPSPRLEADALTRAVIRFSALGLKGAAVGQSVPLLVFLNQPEASGNEIASSPCCVAMLQFVWDGSSSNQAAMLDLAKARSVMGAGGVTLNIVAPPGVQFQFEELCLTLSTQAS